MRYRIAFIGVSGVGKSTLTKYLSESLGLPMNPFGARSTALDMGFYDLKTRAARPYDVDRASLEIYRAALRRNFTPYMAAEEAKEKWDRSSKTCRELFQLNVQQNKMNWEGHAPNFVTDRTTLDDLAYMGLHAPTLLATEFYDRALMHTGSTYSHVFFARMNVFQSLGEDVARVREHGYHLVHEALLEGLLLKTPFDEYSKRVWELPMADLEGRKQWIQKILKDIPNQEEVDGRADA